MTLHEREAQLYAEVFSSVESYTDFSPGEQYVEMFASLAAERADRLGATVLDAGCGSGKGAVALAARGFKVLLCDFTDEGLTSEAETFPFVRACLWDDLWLVVRGFAAPGRSTVDFVYCCDVLEHVPPQFTMLVVNQLLRVASKGVFLSISLMPDVFGAWVGTPLHHTVQSFLWWKESLQEVGHVVDARDLHTNAVFFVEPK